MAVAAEVDDGNAPPPTPSPDVVRAIDAALAKNDFAEALRMAAQHQEIDTDAIYKQWWLATPGSDSDIVNVLDKITDREWALRSLVERPAATPDRLRALMRHAISMTDHVTPADLEAEIDALLEDGNAIGATHGPSFATLCQIRRMAFRQLDRLDCFIELLGPHADIAKSFAATYERFRHQDVADLAVSYAADAAITAVKLLIARFPTEIFPHRSPLWDALPETCSVDEIADILPRFDTAASMEMRWPPSIARELDWTEANASVHEFLDSLSDESSFDDDGHRTHSNKLQQPMTVDALCDFYKSRVDRIETATGQSRISLSLINLASSRLAVPGLERLRDDLTTLVDIIYGCERPDVELSDVASRDARQQLDLILDPVIREHRVFVSRIREIAMPLLKRRNDPEYSVLDNYLVNIARTNLEPCMAVFEASRSGLRVENRLIADENHLAKLVLDCAYAADGVLGFNVIEKLRGSVPDVTVPGPATDPDAEENGWDEDFISSDSMQPWNGAEDLVERVRRFRSHLHVLATFAKHGVEFPLRFLTSEELQASAATQKLTLMRLVKAIDARGSDADWISGLRDLRALLDSSIFSTVNADDMMSDAISVPLTAGKLSAVKDILSLSPPIISASVVEKQTLACATDMYDNSTTADMNRGMMKTALDCLSLLPASESKAAMQSLIEATHMYTALCLQNQLPASMPIQIRLHSNRVLLLKPIISIATKQKPPDRRLLLKIAAKFDPSRQSKSELMIDGLIVSWALDIGDHKHAVGAAQELVSAGLRTPIEDFGGDLDETGLVVVRLIAEAGAFVNDALRDSLYGFALSVCGVRCFDDVLLSKRGAELGGLLDPSNADTEAIIIRKKIKDLETVQPDVQTTGIPVTDFYASVGTVVQDRAVDDMERAQRFSRLHLLQLMLRSSLEKSMSERGVEQEGFLTDDDVLQLAKAIYASGDARLALDALDLLQEVENTRKFFEQFPPSQSNDVLATYHLSSLVLRDADLDPSWRRLPKSPQSVLESVQHFLHSETVSDEKKARLLDDAVFFASRSKSDQYGKILDQILSFPGADRQRFDSDLDYRRTVLLSAARDHGLSLQGPLSISEALGVTQHDLALERVRELAVNPEVRPLDFQTGLEEVKVVFGQSIVDVLCQIHQQLDKSDFEKLVAFYSTLLEASPSFDKRVLAQLSFRVSTLQDFHALVAILGSISLVSLLEWASESNGEAIRRFTDVWADLGSDLGAFQIVSRFVEKLAQLKPISIFPDEISLVENRIEPNVVRGAIAEHYFRELLQDPLVRQRDLNSCFEALKDALGGPKFAGKLLTMHNLVYKADFDKLVAFYKILMELSPSLDEGAHEQLSYRIFNLQPIRQIGLVEDFSLDTLLEWVGDSEEHAIDRSYDIWSACGSDLEALITVANFIDRLSGFTPLSIFPDEEDLRPSQLNPTALKCDLAVRYICALIEDPSVRGSDLKTGFEKLKALLVKESFVIRLCDMHLKMNKADFDKLVAFYSILLETLTSTDDIIKDQLRYRIATLPPLRHFGIVDVKTLNLNLILRWASLSEEDAVRHFSEILSNGGCDLDTLRALSIFIEKIAKVAPLSIFPDESHLPASQLQASVVVSYLARQYFETRLSEIEWEFEEEERVSEEFGAVDAWMHRVTQESDREAIVRLCCVGEAVECVPIILRCRVVDTALSIGHSEQLVSISRHLNMLAAMEKLMDPETGAKVHLERLQQFDSTYEGRKEDAALICMRMVIAGTSPYLVDSACKLLESYWKESDMFTTKFVYQQACLSVMGSSHADPQFASAFRSGIEPPIDALRRIVANLGDASIRSNAESEFGNEADGWDTWDSDEFESVDASDAAKTVKETLVNVVEAADSGILPEIRLDMINLLKEALSTADLKRYTLECLARDIWSMELPDCGVESEDEQWALFEIFLASSATLDHFKGLVAILKEYSPVDGRPQPEHIVDLWQLLFRKMVAKDFIELLCDLRFSLDLEFAFDDQTEVLILNKVKSEPSGHSIKLLLASSSRQISESVLAVVIDSNDPSFYSDTMLHLLLLAKGWAPSLTPISLWKPIAFSLISSSERALVGTVVASLVINSQIARAAEILTEIAGLGSSARSGISTSISLIKGFLTRAVQGNFIHVDPIVRRVQLASLRAIGISESEYIRDALARL